MKVRAIALYLPQFHPTPENDIWWGKGFTEWTNVGKAKPLFRGHEQPKVPADLGYYDLRLPDVRKAQAELARQYGIEGFCYWHYWFGNGRKLLDRPFHEVLCSGEPDFPFCLAWANHSWKKKLWNPDGKGDEILIEQNYLGDEDYIAHFYDVLPAFKDPRYITIDSKPVFFVFAPFDSPEIKRFIELWRVLAVENGLNGIYFVGQADIVYKQKVLELGFDAINNVSMLAVFTRQSKLRWFLQQCVMRLLQRPRIYAYSAAMKYFSCDEDSEMDTIPSVYPNWDHTPRSGLKGIVLKGSTPVLFKKQVKIALKRIKDKPEEHRLLIIKSWNEWGEGNYMEPDLKYGCSYLQAFKDAISEEEF